MVDCSRSAARAFGGLPRGFFGAACGVDVESSCNEKVGASRDTEDGVSCGEGRGVSCDEESEGKEVLAAVAVCCFFSVFLVGGGLLTKLPHSGPTWRRMAEF